ncbi:MAG TPA: hypothetical protein VK211_29100 [Kamptonema sp.]|nr:hypothetical protein [Kamptonema sp.]
MNAADQAAVNAAKNGKTKTRSSVNAEQSKGLVSDRIAIARRKVADATKAQIIGGGISDALTEIARGDFGDVSDSILVSLDEFIEGFDQDVKTLKSAESDPKLLSPSR